MPRFTIALTVLLFAAPSFAGEEGARPPAPERTYTLSAAGLQQIINMLQEVPAKWANPITNELARQVHEAEQVAAQAGPSKGPKKKD